MPYHKQKELLNKISELLCKCRHFSKFLLKNYIGNDANCLRFKTFNII